MADFRGGKGEGSVGAPGMPSLDLTDEEAAALLRELNGIIENDLPGVAADKNAAGDTFPGTPAPPPPASPPRTGRPRR
jgi:hypothetical protein